MRSHTNRRTVLKTAGSLGVVGLAGCSMNGGGNGNGTPTEGLYSMEATSSAWPFGPNNIAYQVAMEKGFFEEEGLELADMVAGAGGGTTVRNLLQGGLHWAEAGLAGIINAWLQGAPLSVFATSNSILGLFWIAPQDSPVESLQDMGGRRMGYTSPGSSSQAIAFLMIEEAEGVSTDDVEFVETGGVQEGLTALDNDAIDLFFTLEPLFSATRQAAIDETGEPKYKVVATNDQPYYNTAYAADPEWLEENADVATGMLRARNRAIDYVFENEEQMRETAEIYTSYNEGFSVDLIVRAIQNFPRGKDYYTDGSFDPLEGIRRMEQASKMAGIIPEGSEVPYAEIIDQSYLPEGVAQIDPANI